MKQFIPFLIMLVIVGGMLTYIMLQKRQKAATLDFRFALWLLPFAVGLLCLICLWIFYGKNQ